MIKIGFFILLSGAAAGNLAAQAPSGDVTKQGSGHVGLLSYDELEARLTTKSDTTYVVNFWATWCGPCLKELPYFDRLQKKYSSKNVKVLLVSLDFRSQLEEQVIPYVEENKLQSEVLVLDEQDQSAVINRVSPEWSGALPATLVVNAAAGSRRFYEGAFTYEELEKFYLLTQN
ncbi:AhpC/TSA family protein [Anseongella ginsenosidimutans]|uniref:AhpC/TSA family protein n=1 Tax=Anseongella ginsenosidimutans TaxID=496056 RepID=A0A4R3KR17_9SPHI|nr:TlpA disulfide reductase family protein [Anseongella ginsenosidimutans]QEC52978.1 TlpA family protein disulfide reductase [Anseongella ginsenosidimutans]TCS87382.1 AhpC/TSA family protein [Anseongella ginsenosidimutans]